MKWSNASVKPASALQEGWNRGAALWIALYPTRQVMSRVLISPWENGVLSLLGG